MIRPTNIPRNSSTSDTSLERSTDSIAGICPPPGYQHPLPDEQPEGTWGPLDWLNLVQQGWGPPIHFVLVYEDSMHRWRP